MLIFFNWSSLKFQISEKDQVAQVQILLLNGDSVCLNLLSFILLTISQILFFHLVFTLKLQSIASLFFKRKYLKFLASCSFSHYDAIQCNLFKNHMLIGWTLWIEIQSNRFSLSCWDRCNLKELHFHIRLPQIYCYDMNGIYWMILSTSAKSNQDLFRMHSSKSFMFQNLTPSSYYAHL